jgi:hypothetical protein
MENAEKAAIMVCLFLGFLWLRRRSRAVDLEKRMGRTVFAVFVLLPGLLIAGRLFFERFRFGTFVDLGLQAAFVLAVFTGIGYFFLPPDKR